MAVAVSCPQAGDSDIRQEKSPASGLRSVVFMVGRNRKGRGKTAALLKLTKQKNTNSNKRGIQPLTEIAVPKSVDYTFVKYKKDF